MYNGIIFYSSFIPDEYSLFIGVDFLNVIKKKFNGYVIFIGVQVGSCDEWIKILNEEKSNLNIFYELCDEKLYVDSDVSGYQKALEIYYKIKDTITIKKDSFSWFGHTKGVTSKNYSYHEWNIQNFWNKKEYIELKLNEDDKYGSYGMHLSYIPDYDKSNIVDLWKEYSNFKFEKSVLNYMFTNTFYVIKLNCFMNMINNLKSDFFKNKIKGLYGEGDRYFFERDFIHFVDMMGYEPLYYEFSPNISWPIANSEDFINNLNKWK